MTQSFVIRGLKAKPLVRLVLREKDAIPEEFADHEWVTLGIRSESVGSDLRDEISTKGYALYRLLSDTSEIEAV